MFSKKKYEEFAKFAENNKLVTVWSIYDVNLDDKHPFEGAKEVVYSDHWGQGIVADVISGDTWGDLFLAADSCIRSSGDDHHMFIEEFIMRGSHLLLTTGS